MPLIDTEDNLLGIMAVRQMPFFVFNDRTLSLLALLAGHVADLLRSDATALQLNDADAQSFSQQLRRSLIDVEQHDLEASLCMFELKDPNQELLRLFADSQRGLDLQIHLVNKRGNSCILVLMPLTSTEGSRGYLWLNVLARVARWKMLVFRSCCSKWTRQAGAMGCTVSFITSVG